MGVSFAGINSLISFALLFLNIVVPAQVTFNKPYGGIDICEVNDGSFVIANASSALKHLDRFGNLMTPIQCSSNYHIYAVANRFGGGFVIGGQIDDTIGSTDGIPFLAEIDTNGATIAFTTQENGFYGGETRAIVESQLGGYAVVTVTYEGTGTTGSYISYYRTNLVLDWKYYSVGDFDRPAIVELSPGKFAYNTFEQIGALGARLVVSDNTGVLNRYYFPDTIGDESYVWNNGHVDANEFSTIYTGTAIFTYSATSEEEVSVLAKLDSNCTPAWQKLIDWGDTTLLKGVVTIPGGGCAAVIYSPSLGCYFVRYNSAGDSLGSTLISVNFSSSWVSNTIELRKTNDRGFIMLDGGWATKFDSSFRILPPVGLDLIGHNPKCPSDTATLLVAPGYLYQWSNGGTTNSISITSPGYYFVTITDPVTGYSANTDTIEIINLYADTAIITTGPLEFCTGDSVVLASPAASINYSWTNGATDSSLTVNTAGVYGLTYTSTLGCEIVCNPLTISVFPDPAIPQITLVGNILYSTPAFSYQWYSDGIPVFGEVNQVFAPSASGNYSVEIRDVNGCSAISLEFPYVFLDDGSTILDEIFKFKMFPNPATDRLYVELICNRRTNLKMVLKNHLGQEVLQAIHAYAIQGSNIYCFDVGGHGKGVYLLEITTEQGHLTKKVAIGL